MPTLVWAGKEHATKEAHSVPYRLLERDESLCYGDATAGNVIVQGDNLAALKALMPYYRGRVRCIYIDPPYNTGAAFEHYDDNVAHGTWLSLMYPRLELLRDFLSRNGSIWISIDDDEGHYLKIICDEIFGRENFVNTVIWEKKYTVANDTKWLSDNHDFILAYAKEKDNWSPNPLPRTNEMNKAYKNPDNHPKGPWKATPLHAKSGSMSSVGFSYTFKNGVVFTPPSGTFPRYSKESLKRMDDNDEIWFGIDGKSIPSRKTFLCDLKKQGVTSKTLWRFDEVGHNHEAREEVKQFNPESVFATPKPERLLKRILTLATNEGDMVLDAFLGSGTTAAVAQKMNRRYIGIEIGEHAVTHVVPRLRKVIDGEEGGISKAENWQGGGGFSFYRLGEEVFTADGQIRKDVKFQTLAAHLWMKATDTPYGSRQPKESDSVREIMSTYGHDSPLLGIHEGTAYYLLYNGILGDRRPDGGNVLTKKVLAVLPPHDGPRIIYGESSRLHEETLKAMGIVFRQIPKEIPAN